VTVETSNWRAGQRARGDEYRTRLLVARVSQREIAAKVGLDPAVVSNCMAGVRKWSPGKEEAFVKALEEAGA
jgi:DNA-binding transcriptional regulator YdaS (Cro superfamily)